VHLHGCLPTSFNLFILHLRLPQHLQNPVETLMTNPSHVDHVMFSHSDLQNHECEHCANNNDFTYPGNRSSACKHDDLSQGGCLWYMLAKACFEWIEIRTQVPPVPVSLKRNGEFTIGVDSQREGGCAYFECLLKSSGMLFSTVAIVRTSV